MSNSPTQFPSGTSGNIGREYLANWNTLGQLVRRGASFSGRERNRCFLNTAGQEFADASAVSGLDLLDDGRAVAAVDWDHDGDLDLWLSNRTGPRIRLMRNNSSGSNNYIAFRLRGTRCNRDAIGARVELVLPRTNSASSGMPLTRMKTLRAGEGFLSQSSKTLHFGLGDHERIAQVKVYWPGDSQPQLYTNMAVNRSHLLVQGEAMARLMGTAVRKIGPSESSAKISASVPTTEAHLEAENQNRSRTILTRRLRLPPTTYRNLMTNAERKTTNGPMLISIWGSWCGPCLRELSEFAKHEKSIRSKGLRILALSVDDIAQRETSGESTDDKRQAARLAIERVGFPFESGFASNQQIRALTELTHQVLYPVGPLSLPCSFLVDANGKLAAFYRGPLDVQQLISDVDLLTANQETIITAAIPIPGRRLLGAQEASPLSVAEAYMEGGYLELARHEVQRYLREVSAQRDFDQLAELLSESTQPGISRNRVETAARSDGGKSLRPSVRSKTLADALRAEQRRLQEEGLRLLVDIDTLRRNPNDVEQSLTRLLRLAPKNESSYGELIIAQTRNGRKDAALKTLKLLQVRARNNVTARLVLGQTLMRLGKSDEAIRNFKMAVGEAPKNNEARFNLAAASQVIGNESAAIEHYRAILKSVPNHQDAKNNLAWLFAAGSEANRNRAEAVRLAEELCQAGKFGTPAHMDTLATALVESGDFQRAAEIAIKAYRLAMGRGEFELAKKLKERVRLLRIKLGDAQPESNAN